jgi:hypothetical protein
MKKAVSIAAGVLLVASLASAAPEAAPPAGAITVGIGGPPLTLWPYTFQQPAAPGTPSDPVNLVFLDSDPREIRQALLALDGARGAPLSMLPFGQCRWSDTLGNEQAAWAETEGWVGSEIQLACAVSGSPLGNPFRFHLRLFRQGGLTLGGAHFEVLIPGTAEHEVLAWDFARDFVAGEMKRTGLVPPDPESAAITSPGTFRAVRWPVYAGLINADAVGVLVFAGLPPAAKPQNPLFGSNVPIPTDGKATVMAPNIVLEPAQARARTAVEVQYNVVTPRPFCGTDFVLLQGPVRLDLDVHTNPSGKYSRTEIVTGSLTVTPMTFNGTTFVPTPGATSNRALVAELHRALLTDNHGQTTQYAAQVLLSNPLQSLVYSLAAGHADDFASNVSCGVP